MYLIDFAHSKIFVDISTGEHSPNVLRKSQDRSTRFQSKNFFLGNEQSRRDDIESIGNILIYFVNNGHLPWMEFERFNLKEQRVFRSKISLQELCENIPDSLLKFMTYCHSMSFETKPNYKILMQHLENLKFQKIQKK